MIVIDNVEREITVMAFFRSSEDLYSHYFLRDGITLPQVEKTIKRARGKADLTYTAYKVSRRMSAELDKMNAADIDWDFKRFYYDIGTISIDDEVPDGILLYCKDAADGKLMKAIPPRHKITFDDIVKVAQKGTIFENVYSVLDNSALERAQKIFELTPEMINDQVYFQLWPFLLADVHKSYYLEEHGIDITKYAFD